MEPLINNGDELYEYFMNCSRPIAAKRVKKIPYEGVFVSSSVRKSVLTNERQGKITIGGTVKRIEFVDKSAGVWLARLYVNEEKGKGND